MPGQDYGLIDLQDDGQGGVQRVPTESYYALRLLIRGLAGGKERLDLSASGLSTATRVLATRDAMNVYIIVLQSTAAATVTVGLAPLGIDSGVATVYEYSAAHKDEIVATPDLTAGRFSFLTAPAGGISMAVVPRAGTEHWRVFLPLVLTE